MNDWWEYVGRVTRNARPIDIAEKTGISAATISRWNPDNKGGGARPEADNVVQFARKYDRSPLEALLHANYIHADEIGQAVEIAGSMRDVSDNLMIEELASRLADFRRLQLGGDQSQEWPPSGWRREDTGVGSVENGDQSG